MNIGYRFLVLNTNDDELNIYSSIHDDAHDLCIYCKSVLRKHLKFWLHSLFTTVLGLVLQFKNYIC